MTDISYLLLVMEEGQLNSLARLLTTIGGHESRLIDLEHVFWDVKP